jgi:hypothetical protein
MIAEGGSIVLTAVVTDGAGTVLESTQADPVSIKWVSSNSSIVSVDEKGALFGKKLGSATITATAFKGGETSAQYSVIVNVVKRNSIDVAELFFNPMQAYVDMNVERVFRLSAVDNAGTATSLSEGAIELVSSNENVLITPTEINLTATGAAVEVRVRGLQKGFSFITPYYTLRSKDENQTVRITGTPLVVQVKDSVETSLPLWNNFDGGGYLSIAVGEIGGYKNIYATHYDKTAKGFLFSNFYSSWAHYTIKGGEETGVDEGRSSQVVLSPFTSNLDQPIVIAIRDKRPILRYLQNGVWFYTDILDQSEADIIDENRTYADNARLASLTAFKATDANSSYPSRLHIAYYDPIGARVCLASYSSPSEQIANSRNCINVEENASVHSVSIAHNRVTGEPRMVYGRSRHSYIGADGNETSLSGALFYVSRQNGDLYREALPIDGNAGFASIALDRNNKPFVAVKEGSYVRVYSREAVGSNFEWGLDPLGGTDPIQGEIASVSFALDGYNEPRIGFAANAGNGLKIRYARKPPFRNLGSRWVVEDPGQNVAGNQGRSSAIAVDSANRAHLVYSVEDKKWFNYWAEPNFFDYRNFPSVAYSGADLIE